MEFPVFGLEFRLVFVEFGFGVRFGYRCYGWSPTHRAIKPQYGWATRPGQALSGWGKADPSTALRFAQDDRCFVQDDKVFAQDDRLGEVAMSGVAGGR